MNFCTGTKGIKILYDSVFKEISDTGINMDLLQEYVYIPLDVFQKIVQNKGVRNKLEAWLMFFSTDEPEKNGGTYGKVSGVSKNVQRNI